MKAQGIQPPTSALQTALSQAFGPEISSLLSILTERAPNSQKYKVSLAPSSVAANSESVETVALGGISPNQVITINKPTRTTGINVVQVWSEAKNELKVAFQNTTSAAITPPQETYRVFAFAF